VNFHLRRDDRRRPAAAAEGGDPSPCSPAWKRGPPRRRLMVPMSPRTAGYLMVALVMAACGGAVSGQPDGGTRGDGGGSSGSGSGAGSSGSSTGSSGSASGGDSSSSGSGGNSGGSSGGMDGSSSGGVSGGSSGTNCSGSGSGVGVSCCWSHGGATAAQHQQCVWQCCLQVDPSDGMSYLTAAQACVCGSGGPCASACAGEFCMNGTFTTYGDACGNCVQQALSGTCASVNKCGSGCGYYSQCITGCP
jgi:hypothetical protein